MKFLCDRCKTRYSIGDERVRGKILKIRCKNCANVITVREGMGDGDEAPTVRANEASPPNITAPPPANGRGNALNAAFANAMAKPPPALEEEWYVSLDGNQEGPFSLAEAQRWVAQKPFAAELYCWSEGFDDWLPVDKVSHFRGLRKRPAPAPVPQAPPPVPRSAPGRMTTRAHAVAPAPAVEEEPKPLFAATMASLERAAATATTPAARSTTPLTARATPPKGQPALGYAGEPRKNGSAAPAPIATKQPSAPVRAPLNGFKFDVRDAGESATQIETPPLAHTNGAAAATAAAAAPATSAAASADISDGRPANDDIDIGEVSRVVNLADLVKQSTKPAQRRSQPLPNLPASSGRTGAVAKISSTAIGPTVAADGPGGEPLITTPPELAPMVAEPRHRHGLVALLIAALVVIGAAIAVVVFVVNRTDDTATLGGDYDISTERPVDPIRRPGDPPPTQPDPPQTPKRPTWVGPRPTNPPPIKPIDTSPTGSLSVDEIEGVIDRNRGSTIACWRRVQRGSDGILFADLKKISVTITVSAEGTVTNIGMSDNHDQDNLGKCLRGAIVSWRFRPNGAGTYRFSLQFG